MSTAAIALLVSTLLFIVVLGYYWFKLRGATAKIKQNGACVAQKQQQQQSQRIHDGQTKNMAAVAVVKPMYKPADVGHRTGHKRVFISSKGLKVYDTNEHGWPMPPLKAEAS